MHRSKSPGNLSPLVAGYILFFPVAMGIVGDRMIISDIFLSLIIFVGIFRALYQKSFRVISLDAVFLSFVAFSLIGVNISKYFLNYSFEITSFIYMYIGARILSADISDKMRLKRFLDFLSNTFLFFICLFAFSVFLHSLGFEDITGYLFASAGRLKGFFRFTNQLSIFLICLWPIVMIKYFKQPIKRFFFYGVFLVVIASIGSRSGFWISIIQTALMEFFYPEESKSLSLIFRLISFTAISFLTVSLLANTVALQRSLGNSQIAVLEMDEARVINLRQAFNASENWVTGYGLGCFHKDHRHEVHNTLFSVLVETGIGGFISISMLILLTLAILAKSSDIPEIPNLKAAIMISLAGMAGVGMFIYLLRTRSCWLVFAIILAFSQLQKNESAECHA